MKTNTKIGLIIIASIIIFSAFVGERGVYATTTSSGSDEGHPTEDDVEVRNTFYITQNSTYNPATSLHFKLFSDSDVTAWEATISHFQASSCAKSGTEAANFDAWDGNVAQNDEVTVHGTLWLESRNSLGICETTWSGSGTQRTILDHIWSVFYPRKDPLTPGTYLHDLTITNYESTESLTFTGFTFLAIEEYIDDLTTISFPDLGISDFALPAGGTWSYDIPSVGSLIGGHIYFKYAIQWNGVQVLESIADHPVTSPGVGGVAISVDKFGLLAPYIGLTSTIIVATVASAIYVKRRKKKQ